MPCSAVIFSMGRFISWLQSRFVFIPHELVVDCGFTGGNSRHDGCARRLAAQRARVSWQAPGQRPLALATASGVSELRSGSISAGPSAGL